MPGILHSMYDPADREVRCPRCGYDQRGVIATWRESCPLKATCTECGLHYTCAEAIHPEKFEPRWCVEFCDDTPLRFARSCLGTLARSFLPWLFWSRLKMSHRIRPKRIAIYLALLLLPVVLVYAIAQTTAALYVRSLVQGGLAMQAANAQAVLSQPKAETDEEIEALLIREHGQGWVEQFKENRPETWQSMIEQRRRMAEWRYMWAETVAENPSAIEGSVVGAVLEALLMPLAEESFVSIANTPFGGSYPAPSELWAVVAESFAGRAAGAWNVDPWMEAIELATSMLAFGLLMALLFPISLALLPISRRKAKVRWAHIGRITAYGMFIPVATVLSAALLIVIDALLTQMGGGVAGLAALLVVIGAIPLGTALWWTFAINRHLKIPRSLAITGVLMLLCFLAVLALVYHLAPHRLFGDEFIR